jgi:predicted MPP superfamily phosphohydrolase
VPIDGLPQPLAGYSIVQLTDIHHDEWISIEQVRRAVDLANGLGADLVALTGDYVTSRGELIGPAVKELARLKGRSGVVGVMGNHDWWTDAKETRRQFRAYGIPLIDNDRLFVSPDRRLSEGVVPGGLCVAGVGDLWEDSVEPEKALAGVPPEMPRILLSHNPDVTEQDAIGAAEVRVDLILSGHTHGGQVRLPVVGTPVVPSAYGQKYAQGLVQGPACRVQVSAGVGMGVLPVRMGVPPEVVLIRLVPA